MAVLSAPFPYHGAKSRIAADVWAAFGEVGVFSEPFCGSCAVLLASPRISPREIVNDQNGHIANFWRAIRADPEAVAYWADYPSFHHDLTARHSWLIQWARTSSRRLIEDADWYDVKAAGWWVFGISLWIGGGWCVDVGQEAARDQQPAPTKPKGTVGVAAQRSRIPQQGDKRLLINPKDAGGTGVSAQRLNVPGAEDRMPKIVNRNGGAGVSAQRERIPRMLSGGGGNGVAVQRESIPKMASRPGADGVSAQRLNIPGDKVPKMASRTAGGQGVSAQRTDIPVVPEPSDRQPRTYSHPGGERVSAQRRNVPGARDQMPKVVAVGGGFGVSAQRPTVPDQRPHVADRSAGGNGVAAQRTNLPDQRPFTNPVGGGNGVSAQRHNLPDGIPHMADRPGARGVSAQRRELDSMPALPARGSGQGVAAARRELEGYIGNGDRLLWWFENLAQRFARVITLNRDWTSAVTPTVLQHTPSSPKPPVGILLDPPYRTTTGRSDTLYHSDFRGESESVAEAAYVWAVEHGEVYRIAYCCHVDDFPVPEGWRVADYPLAQGRAGAADRVMYSPACEVPAEQGRLI